MRRNWTEEEFWANAVEDEEGCWIWQGPFTPFLYGALMTNGQRLRAHTKALELSGRWVPEGMCVRHLCHMPPCVNPAHLEIGTHAENMADKKTRTEADRTRMVRYIRQFYLAR